MCLCCAVPLELFYAQAHKPNIKGFASSWLGLGVTMFGFLVYDAAHIYRACYIQTRNIFNKGLLR